MLPFSWNDIKEFKIEGKKRTISGIWAILFSCVGGFMSAWYIYTSGFGAVSSETNRAFYILFTLILVYLLFPATKNSPKDRPSIVDILAIVLLAISLGYWINQYMDYAMFRVTRPTDIDLTMGIIAIILVIEGVRRTLGPVIPILTLLFLGQLYFGRYLPGNLAHAGMPISRILEFSFMQMEALFGTITQTFATLVFPFIIFGAFLEVGGAGQFFIDFAKSITGRWRGGPAKIATLTSALFGSISGSSVANVATTGAFTIPMMKREGFQATQAGAIEAIASTGGQFMPPIMGAAAFIMATLTRTPYIEIVIAGTIPALIYFMFVMSMVDLTAHKEGLKGMDQEDLPKPLEVLKRGWYYFIPLFIIIFMLMRGFSADMAAFSGIISAWVLTLFNKEKRMGPRKIGQALVEGARKNMVAGSAIGALGLIVGGITLAGLGLKFASVIVAFAGGNLFLTVFLVLLISILIGMGSTTTGSYIILSVIAAPALIFLDVPIINAHMVVFYGAALSNITPPVCVSAFTAAAIADSDPMQTGIKAFKYGVVILILPFTFVYYPHILLSGTILQTITAVFIVSVGLLALAFGIMAGDFINIKMKLKWRIVFIALSVLILAPTTMVISLIGSVLAILFWLLGFKIRNNPLSNSGEVIA